MEAIKFPISRESACCGIYIYSDSTRVGLKSKEELRSEYIREYEQRYRAVLERKRKLILQQKRDNAPKSAKVGKPEVVLDYDNDIVIGADWVKPAVTKKKPVTNREDNFEYVSNGVDLFSVVVEKEDSAGYSGSSGEDFVDDGGYFGDDAVKDGYSDDEFVDDSGGAEFSEESFQEDVFDESFDDVTWDEPEVEEVEEVAEVHEPEVIEPEITEPEEPPKPIERVRPPKQDRRIRENINRRSEYRPKVFSEIKQPRVEEPVKRELKRLDESAIREFVKTHKLCSEQDIIDDFAGHEPAKIKAVIKSAARHYRVFEKHGRFTV